jgi:hypothetical protein
VSLWVFAKSDGGDWVGQNGIINMGVLCRKPSRYI